MTSGERARLTWIRRNWVDLILVVVILGVVLGFLVLLLRGAQLGGRLGGSAAAPAASLPGAQTVLEPGAQAVPEPGAQVVPEPAAATEVWTEGAPPVIEAEPSPARPPAAEAVGAPDADAQAPDADTQAPDADAQAPDAAPAGPTVADAARPPTRAEYRIGIAAYTDAARAKRVAERVTAAGFPAFALPSRDDLTVVLAGPFRDAQAAGAALETLRRSYPGAVVYRPKGASETPESAATAAPAAATDAAPVSFQVGAFRDPQSARPLLERLRGAGYAVALRSGRDGLTRVVLGPVRAADAERTRADLRARGLSAFVAR